MDTIGKNFKYKVVPNFIEKTNLPLLLKYCKIRHLNNFDNDRFIDKQSQGSTSFYADSLMESLLVCKKNLMEEITNKKLHPTYSFWRMYTYLDELKKLVLPCDCLSMNLSLSKLFKCLILQYFKSKGKLVFSIKFGTTLYLKFFPIVSMLLLNISLLPQLVLLYVGIKNYLAK